MVRSLPIVSAAILAASAALAASGASAQPRPQRQCFFSRDITNWRAVGDRQVNLELRHGLEVWRLDLARPCPELRFAGQVIGVEASGGQPICSGIQADIVVPRQGPTSCPVGTLRRLSKAEVTALPKKERP